MVTCFNEDTDGILLGIDKRIYIGFSDETFEGFNDENIEVIVTGVRYGINGDVGWFVFDDLGGIFGRDSYSITIRLEVI